MCDSCINIMEQFQKAYINVQIEAVSYKKDLAEKSKNKNLLFEEDVKRRREENEG